jgi:hypothetical protein
VVAARSAALTSTWAILRGAVGPIGVIGNVADHREVAPYRIGEAGPVAAARPIHPMELLASVVARLTARWLQIDDSCVPHGPDHWRWPPGRADQWGVTDPHTPRRKRIQDLYDFTSGDFRLQRAIPESCGRFGRDHAPNQRDRSGVVLARRLLRRTWRTKRPRQPRTPRSLS